MRAICCARRKSLPNYDNREFYSTSLQTSVLQHVRAAAPEAFDSLIAQIKDRIACWPYCALIGGFVFDPGNRLFVAVNRAFGELVARPYEKPRAQLVHYIQPSSDIMSARGGHESERLHTDTADWEPPVELISMVCVRADPDGGGRSRILDVDSIRGEVSDRLGGATLEHLESEAVPWQLASYCGGGVQCVLYSQDRVSAGVVTRSTSPLIRPAQYCRTKCCARWNASRT